jgi:hypothetical protein
MPEKQNGDKLRKVMELGKDKIASALHSLELSSRFPPHIMDRFCSNLGS